MLSARNLLYGFAASLVLFTIVMAIEQIYVREVDAVIAASHSPRDAKPGVPRVRGASVPTAGPAEIEATPEDGTPDRGASPGMSQRSGTPRSQSGVAASWSQPVGPNKQGSAVDEGWLNTITSAFATAQGGATGSTLRFGERDYPVQAAGWGANGRVLVTAMLPVAGTFITQYNLAGPWTVRVALNGQVVGKDTFELLSRN